MVKWIFSSQKEHKLQNRRFQNFLAKAQIAFLPFDSPGGENYGWSVREGANGPELEGATDPVHDYFHGFATDEGNCVIGGYVYRGPIHALQGRYFFGDNRSERIWSFQWDRSDPSEHDGSNFTEFLDWTNLISDEFGDSIRISSFGEDAVGNLYILNHVPTAGENLIRIDSASLVLAGDVNCDGVVDLLDVVPFVQAILSDEFDAKADINFDGSADLLDIQPFVELVTAG